MSDEVILHPDSELWLCDWTRAVLPSRLDGVTLEWVANMERPEAAGGGPSPGAVHVIFRDDSGPERDLVLKDSAVGVTVIGYSRLALKPTRDAARLLVALIKAQAPHAAGSPIADVEVTGGPYTVPSPNDEARLYAVLDLTTVGAAI